jgi:hypothetical protein
MDIGTIIAGLQAIGSLFNQPVPMTPAQAEEKPKKAQAPINTFVVFPNQTPPMGVGVPPSPPPVQALDYWSQLPPANVLRNPIWRMPQMPFGVPVFRGVPLTTDFRIYSDPLLEELYQLYFGTRR